MVRTAPLTRAVALFASCLFSSLVVAATDSDNFHQALDAARNNDWETLSRQQQALGEQHPLQAYLDFHRLRAALPQLGADKVNQYAEPSGFGGGGNGSIRTSPSTQTEP